MIRLLPLMALAVWLAAAPRVSWAQVRSMPYRPTCEAPAREPSCEAGRPTCAAPEPTCAAKRPCPPCNPPQQPPVYLQPQGVFVQPPASGTVRGPVEQSGVEGGSITFPELSLRMPSLRLPGFSKTRQNARMETDQQMAPFVESPAAPAAAMPMQQAPMMAAPPQQMMAVQQAPQMMMMQMPASQMMMAPVQMVPPQQQYVPQQQFVPQPPAAPQPPPEEPPLQQRRDPSCDARNMQSVATAEEKIRQLELVEQQLKQRMDELRRQLQQIQTSDRPPTPTPDLGARRIPQPGRQPALQPVSQPIMQPALRPAQLRPQQYQERPAAYATEPQPIREPAPQYIREPQAATATITGFRQR